MSAQVKRYDTSAAPLSTGVCQLSGIVVVVTAPVDAAAARLGVALPWATVRVGDQFPKFWVAQLPSSRHCEFCEFIAMIFHVYVDSGVSASASVHAPVVPGGRVDCLSGWVQPM